MLQTVFAISLHERLSFNTAVAFKLQSPITHSIKYADDTSMQTRQKPAA